MNMSLVRKLSGLLPEPMHLKRKQRRSIFPDKDSNHNSKIIEGSDFTY